MRLISGLFQPSSGVGLHNFKLDKLGQLVVFAGKNGSGKTRVVRLLAEFFTHGINPVIKDSVDSYLKSNYSNINNNDYHLSDYKLNYADFVIKIEDGENSVKVIEAGSHPNLYADWTRLSYFDLSRVRLDRDSFSIQSAYSDCAPVLKKVIDLRNRDLITGESEGENQYNRLNKLLNKLLGTELEAINLDVPGIFGRDMNEAKLSDGQRILLYYAVAIFIGGGGAGNSVIFMDEPENHLHPAALKEVIQSLLNLGVGQIFIATHSVHLIAEYPDSLYYVENGKVDYAGKNPEHVLRSLLGDDTSIEKMRTFLLEPAVTKMLNFTAECILPAAVVDTPPLDDPQTKQVHGVLRQKYEQLGRPLRVLDYGAGKGRLLSALEALSGSSEKFHQSVDYYAFEVSSDVQDLKNKLESVYSESTDRLYCGKDILLNNGIKFDVIILMNVFHEISPDEWNELFDSNGLISQILAQDGYLMVVEDHILAVGEHAHSYGFLVFDVEEFRILFKSSGKDVQTEKSDSIGRLKAHLIRGAALAGFRVENIKDAIEHLSSRSMARIKQLKVNAGKVKGDKKLSHHDGREYAFWSQQAINCQLYLSSIEQGPE